MNILCNKISLFRYLPLHPDVNPIVQNIYIDIYTVKIHKILNATRKHARYTRPGWGTYIHDNRFARTGFHDENEWLIYKFILSKEKINVHRSGIMGLDSSIWIDFVK